MPKKDQRIKINVKERVEDNVCDLSLSELNEVPVSQIVSCKRVTILDLSSNRLVKLGSNFVTLTRLVKLDLSKNQLIDLPEEFGLLHSLRHLDLYDNKLEHLPLSFGELSSLRYLDLKGNPLVPALVKIVGFCSTAKECQESARNTVRFMASMQIEALKLKAELQKQILEKQTTDEMVAGEMSGDRKLNSDDNQNTNGNNQSNSQNQMKSKKSTKKSKTKTAKNPSNQVSSNHKAVQTNFSDFAGNPMKNIKPKIPIQSTALSSILTFFILLAFNIFVIYLVMFKNPEIADILVNLIPQQYRNWIAESTEFFRLRVTDRIMQFITPPEEH